MSASEIKASRRELRKAFGSEAIDVINSHADTLSDIMHGMELFNDRIGKLEARCDALEASTFYHRLPDRNDS